VCRGHTGFLPNACVVDQHSIVFLTAPANKLLKLTVSDPVVFEADFYDELFSKSVVIHARPTRVETMAESAAAEALPLTSPIPPTRTRCEHIVPTSITGQGSGAHAKRYQGVTAHLLLRNRSLGTIFRSYSPLRSAGGHAPPLGGEVTNPLVRGLRSAVAEQLPRWRE